MRTSSTSPNAPEASGSSGTLSPTPFLDITSQVLTTGSEQGLLGLAFHPNDHTRFFVYYTRRSDGANVLASYRLTSADAADPITEQLILAMPDPFPNHNGGQLAFGPRDGYLYIGTGDGGSGGDPGNRAQNPNELLGKILRLDVDSAPYVIPQTNPNFARREIWATGLRNPWRFSFDRVSGDLYVADVGQSAYEEINFQPGTSAGGENYGWRFREGAHCFNPSTNCDPGGLTDPVAEYSHAFGCSVTGGYVYRGSAHPRMQGIYFYGDYCSGRVWGLVRDGTTWTNTQLLDTNYLISTFGEDASGELYLADYAGTIYRLTDAGSATPTPTRSSLFCAAAVSPGPTLPTPSSHRSLLPAIPSICDIA